MKTVAALLILFLAAGLTLANRQRAQQASQAERERQAGAASYSATAATFAGDNQCWMELDSTGGASDGTYGTLSLWWNPGTGDTTTRVILATNDRFRLQRAGGDNSVRLILSNSSGTPQIELRQNTAIVASLTSSSGWTWIACAWDTTTTGQCWMYMANAATSWVAVDCTTRTTDLGASANIDYSDFDWTVGDNLGGGSQPMNGCLAEVYLDLTQARVLSSSSVRDQFYSSTTHKPAGDLTSFGTPFIYLKGDGTGFTVNSGNAGNFNKKGTTAFTSCTGP